MCPLVFGVLNNQALITFYHFNIVIVNIKAVFLDSLEVLKHLETVDSIRGRLGRTRGATALQGGLVPLHLLYFCWTLKSFDCVTPTHIPQPDLDASHYKVSLKLQSKALASGGKHHRWHNSEVTSVSSHKVYKAFGTLRDREMWTVWSGRQRARGEPFLSLNLVMEKNAISVLKGGNCDGASFLSAPPQLWRLQPAGYWGCHMYYFIVL